jgi:hypothetical protein
MKTITIIPTSKRAKDRVNSHGEVMELVRRRTFNNVPAVLVRSLENTSFGNEPWLGWFTEDEIDIGDSNE